MVSPVLLSLCSGSIFCESTLRCSNLRRSHVSARLVPADAIYLYSDQTQEAEVLASLSLLRNPSTWSETKLSLQGLRSAFLSLWSPESTSTPLIFVTLLKQCNFTPFSWSLFHNISIFFCSLLKSAANAVLKLMSELIAIANIRSVSIKSLSVSTFFLLSTHSTS